MPIRQRYQFQHNDGLKVEGVKVGRINGGISSNFIVYRIGNILIDSGPSNQWRHVKGFLQEGDVKELWLTHHHEDHSGNASRVGRAYNLVPKAPVQAKEKLAKGFRIPAIQRMTWGKAQRVITQPLGELFLEDSSPVIAIHTPGHAEDLTCFYLPKQRWFFSGDLYIAKTLKYMRSDENLSQLMHSIKKVLEFDFDVVFCPHRGIDEAGKAGMQAKLKNLTEICRKAQSLSATGLSLNEITEQMLGPKEYLDKISRGNMSKANLISQALLVQLNEFA